MPIEKVIKYLEWVKNNNYLNASISLDVREACDTAIRAIRENEAQAEEIQNAFEAGFRSGYITARDDCLENLEFEGEII